MASTRWIGNAPIVPTIFTITVTAYDATTTYKVTMGVSPGKVVSVLGSGGTTTTVAAALAAALAASAFPEFTEVTWTSALNVITGTGLSDGRPVTAVSSVSGGTGTIGAVTTTTTASSPNDLNVATNYSVGALPANGDDLWFDAGSVPVLWNLAALAGVTLNSLHVTPGYRANIGLPEVNTSGSAPYEEYRATYLKLPATTQTIDASSMGQLKLDDGTVQTALTILGAGSRAESDLEVIQWKGTHASNVVNAYGNTDLAIAGYGGDVATVATLNVAGTANVRCGAGATLTTVNEEDGALDLSSNATTVTMLAGTLTTRLAAAFTTLTNTKGTIDYFSSGTITTLTLGPGATLDASGKNVVGFTITNAVQAFAGATILDPLGKITFSAGVKLNRCGYADVNIDWGPNRTVTPS